MHIRLAGSRFGTLRSKEYVRENNITFLYYSVNGDFGTLLKNFPNFGQMSSLEFFILMFIFKVIIKWAPNKYFRKHYALGIIPLPKGPKNIYLGPI